MSKDASITAIFGRRGSGKTTLIKAQIEPIRRLLIFDPQNEYAGKGIKRVSSGAQIAAAIAKAGSGSFQLAYWSEHLDGREAMHLHQISEWLRQHQQPYFDSAQGIPDLETTLVVDEMDLSYGNDTFKRDYSGFQRLIRQGRHCGISIIGATQFPTQIRPDFRRNALRTYIFPLADASAIRNVKEFIGGEAAERVRNLQPHHALKYENGLITEHENPPLKRRGRTRKN